MARELISSNQISRFIICKYKEQKFNTSYIKKLPFMIRNNGLTNTLEYLSDKDNNVSKLIIDYILEKYNIYILEIKNLKSFDYMILQKDVYEFSIKLRNLCCSMEKVESE